MPPRLIRRMPMIFGWWRDESKKLLIGSGALAAAGGGASYLGLRQMGSREEYDASVAATRAALSQQTGVRDLIRYATLAANGHNTQAWRFRVFERRVEILPDFSRLTPVVDPDDHHLFASLGCAAENLVLAASARGRPGEISFDPTNDGALVYSFHSAASEASALFDAIPTRQSTRADYDGRAVSADDLRTLAAAAGAVAGVDLVLITDRSQTTHLRDLVLSGNNAQLADPAFIRELKTWLRFNPRQAIETGDGLFSATTGNPALPAWLGPSLLDIAFKADAENKEYASQIQSPAGIAVFVSERDDKDHWIRAGRACQRFALQATALGLKHAFINQPVDAASLRPNLAALVGMPRRRPDIVMRFGYGAALPFSARRPVEAVLA